MEFQEQIWPIKDRLFRLAYCLVNDRAEAEDVVQEVMIKLWKQGQGLLSINNLEAWCLRLTKNQALDKLKGGYRKRKAPLEHMGEPSTAANSNPDLKAEQQDLYDQVQQMMQRLPADYQSVVQLRDIEGMTYQEIADALDMSLAQVKTNLFRARKKLREALEKRNAYGL
ncbi:MAG: RNA polymerase sigma factor [Bacteroidota bacterium]